MEEIWKDIEGYEGLYQVSNMGRVRSLIKNIILKKSITNRGYEIVHLYKNKKGKHFRVHRLVATAFISNPNNYPIVNHKDENKANNYVDNLEWCDCKYNINYGTGIARRAQKQLNDKNKSKIVLQYTKDDCFIKEWKSTMHVERNLGFDHANISACCRNIRKTAYGYIWKYKKEIE